MRLVSGGSDIFTFAGGTMLVMADGDRPAWSDASEEAVLRHQLDVFARNAQRPEDLRPDYLAEMRGLLPVAKPERTG